MGCSVGSVEGDFLWVWPNINANAIFRIHPSRVASEPAHSQSELTYIIQKHDASRLHYDFRLELDGVLKSWAVPKGPDLDPANKRLAMQVEDHPLEYGGFEGVIPKGQYGGGTVMLWDRGVWEPIGDPSKGFREGRLKFTLRGEKLQGAWMLVRKGGRKGEEGERHWFLFKERDEFARPGNRSRKSCLSASPQAGTWTRSQRNPTAFGDRLARSRKRVAVKPGAVRKSAASTGRQRSEKEISNGAPSKRTSAVRRAASKPVVHASGDDEVAGMRLSHPDKVLYAEQGITKRDLARYYELVADWMLPHVIDRPLALVRCPAGSRKPCFFQKHPGEGASEHLRRVNISEEGAAEYNLAIDDLAGLISLVQMSVLEIHAWGSHARHLEKPDRLIFDLDPDPSVDWKQVTVAAREVRLVLEELGLTSFLKTTGGKGLHLVVPIQPRTEWDEAKAFCREVADLIVRAAPDRYIATMSKAARKGKIFIDYLRNGRGSTAIAPYSTRAKARATVSVPIAWQELSPKLSSDHFTVENLPARLKKLKKDPWAEMSKTKQSITAKMLERLTALQ